MAAGKRAGKKAERGFGWALRAWSVVGRSGSTVTASSRVGELIVDWRSGERSSQKRLVTDKARRMRDD